MLTHTLAINIPWHTINIHNRGKRASFLFLFCFEYILDSRGNLTYAGHSQNNSPRELGLKRKEIDIIYKRNHRSGAKFTRSLKQTIKKKKKNSDFLLNNAQFHTTIIII